MSRAVTWHVESELRFWITTEARLPPKPERQAPLVVTRGSACTVKLG